MAFLLSERDCRTLPWSLFKSWHCDWHMCHTYTYFDKLSGYCLSVRWGQRSSRSGCWGSGWTAVLQRAGFWWPCKRARGGGTTRLSLKWWRSGWTVIGSLPLVQLFLMGRKRRRTKTSKQTNSWHHLTLQHSPLAFPTYGNTQTHL